MKTKLVSDEWFAVVLGLGVLAVVAAILYAVAVVANAHSRVNVAAAGVSAVLADDAYSVRSTRIHDASDTTVRVVEVRDNGTGRTYVLVVTGYSGNGVLVDSR